MLKYDFRFTNSHPSNSYCRKSITAFFFKIVAFDVILSTAALTFQSLGVTKRNTRLKILHGAHIAFMCFVLISEQTVAFALYNTDRLIFITEAYSVQCAVRTGSLYIKV